MRKVLNNINQLCKKMRINSSYTLCDNIALMFDRNFKMDEKTKKMKEDIGYSKIEFHDNKYIIGGKFHIKDGNSLYPLLKDKNSEVSFTDKGNIKLVLNDVKEKVNTIKTNKDISLYDEYKDKIKEYKLIHEDDITQSALELLSDTAKLYVYDIPNVGKVRITSSMMKGIKKSSNDIKLNIYEVDAELSIYVGEIIIKEKSYTIKHIYKFITF